MTLLSGGFIEKQTIRQYQTINGGAPSVIYTGNQAYQRSDWYLERGETPGYHKLKTRGELLPFVNYRKRSYTGAYSSKFDLTQTVPRTPPQTPTITHWWMTPESTLYPNGCDNASSLPSDHDALVNSYFPSLGDYVQAAAANIYSKGWDTLTFMGELGQVVQMFRKFGFNLISLIKKPDFRKISDAYLMARYGLRPLYYDMIAIDKALRNIDGERRRFKENARGGTQKTRVFDNPWNWATSTGNVRRTDEIYISVGGAVVADIEPPRFQYNIPITAWELLTFSFIYDWFINVGQWIESMSFLANQSDYKAGITFKVSIDTQFDVTSCVPKQYVAINDVELICNVNSTVKYRAPATVPLSVSTIRRLNLLKVLDLVLIVQKLWFSRR